MRNCKHYLLHPLPLLSFNALRYPLGLIHQTGCREPGFLDAVGVWVGDFPDILHGVDEKNAHNKSRIQMTEDRKFMSNPFFAILKLKIEQILMCCTNRYNINRSSHHSPPYRSGSIRKGSSQEIANSHKTC